MTMFPTRLSADDSSSPSKQHTGLHGRKDAPGIEGAAVYQASGETAKENGD